MKSAHLLSGQAARRRGWRFWLALLAWSGMSGCHREEVPSPSKALPAVVVRVQVVEPQRHLATEEVVGTVQAQIRASVEAKVSGRIEQLLVAPGQQIKAGQLLAVLDDREIKSQLDQAQAMLDQANVDLKRFGILVEQKAVARAEFDAVQTRQRVAEAGVRAATAQLAHTRVVAPFDGVVTRKLADVGDLAAPGKALFDLEASGVLRLEADVPESLIDRVRLGAKFQVSQRPGADRYEGTVSEIAPSADPASRTFRVKLDLPQAAGLRAGQFARVAIPVGEHAVARVRRTALLVRGQLETVFVETNGVAQLRLVRTGKALGDEIELLAGVEPGERVIIEGAGALRDGQPVRVQP